ncbi:SWIM-type domain-containing protein, partial [Aphis craccivora]
MPNENTIQIKALILQTSYLNDFLHEVNGELVNHSLSILPFTCSCKAGTFECCKHVVAVLLFLNKNPIADLESLLSTDIKCQWSKLRSGFISCEPTSAIALHTFGRHLLGNSFISNQNETVQNYQLNVIFTSINGHLAKLPSNEYGRLLSLKDKTFWESCKQFRITGSRCYGLYTFNKTQKTDEQWSLKLNKYFWPNSFTNKCVKHGNEYESTARNIYARHTNQKILECGLITNTNNPWLGYTPDGVIVNCENKPIKLIEIKCPLK